MPSIVFLTKTLQIIEDIMFCILGCQKSELYQSGKIISEVHNNS